LDRDQRIGMGLLVLRYPQGSEVTQVLIGGEVAPPPRVSSSLISTCDCH
jgi:hypothetical protein